MEIRLLDIVPWKGDYIYGKFVACVDQQSSSGNFPFTAFLLKFISEGIIVHLLATNHSRRHYEYLFKKHNFDLDLLENNRKIFITYMNAEVDTFPVYESQITANNTNFTIVYANNKEENFHSFDVDIDHFWHHVKAQSTGNRIAILIDDLDTLEVSLEQSSEVLEKCHAVLNELKDGGCVLVSGAGGGIADGNGGDNWSLGERSPSLEPSGLLPGGDVSVWCGGGGWSTPGLPRLPTLTERCMYRSDVTVTVSALSSGYSTEVHGQIDVLLGLQRARHFYKVGGDSVGGIRCSVAASSR